MNKNQPAFVSPRLLTTVLIWSLLSLLVACAGPPHEPPQVDPPSPDGLAPFARFVAAIDSARHEDFRTSEVASAAAFEKMKAHLQELYRGIEVGHSFVMAEGQPVDCVPIDQQPALRRPAMAGHQIASPPEFPARPAAAEGPTTTAVGWNLVPGKDRFGNDRQCAEGSFPMRRITLDELTRFATLRHFLSKSPDGGGLYPAADSAASTSSSTHYYAHAYQRVENTGATSTLNLWSPTVASGEMSLSQQWIVAGSGDGLQTVEGGWQVMPRKYTTNLAVPFIYWTSADYADGCYNLECTAFVQVESQWLLGAPWPADKYSVSNGQQTGFRQAWYYYQGNWWLEINGVAIGYYPGSLYGTGPLASGAATAVDFGGEDTGTTGALQMGSGQFANAGAQLAAFQSKILFYLTDGGTLPAALVPSQHYPSCYTIDLTSGSSPYFYFGGPSCAG